MTATVAYQIATYSGSVSVWCDPDDDNEVIIARTRQQLSNRFGPLPFGCKGYKVIGRD